MNRFGVAVALGLLAGCHGKLPEQQGAVLEGVKFGWAGLNHRLSTLHAMAGMDSTEVAVVGGMSTTGGTPELPDTCDPDLCGEFPVTDSADIEVWWSTVSTTEVALVPLTVELEVGRDGESATATGTLPKGKLKGDATAILSGLSFRTDHPLEGEPSCYQPKYGWHPQELSISLGEVKVDGETVSVPVEASFAAGKCFEGVRTCVDEVNDRAVVSLEVHLLAIVGTDVIETKALTASAEYPHEPGADQAEVEPTAMSFGIEDPLVGFGSIDFRFDPDRTDDRGAYLRSLGFWATPGEANAIATNASATQLYDFAYQFDGEIRAIETGGTITRGQSTITLPAALDAEGKPVLSSLEH